MESPRFRSLWISDVHLGFKECKAEYLLDFLRQSDCERLYLVGDLIVFSYCLSMIDPGWERAVDSALRDLRPGGRLAVVDFHDTRFAGFRRWMGVNHVRMDGHLLSYLNARCPPVAQTLHSAYGGGWRYFRFIGQKPGG